MEVNNIPQDVIEKILIDIRKKPEYVKLQNQKAEYTKKCQFIKAAQIGKILKDIEVKAVSDYVNGVIKMQTEADALFRRMTEEDSDMLSVCAYAIGMCADVIESMVIDMDSIYKKYSATPITKHYDALRAFGREAKNYVRYIDGSITQDDFYCDKFGDACDNLHELTINKAKGFIRKVREYADKKESDKKTA